MMHLHCYPVGDLIEHDVELHEDCVCGPRVELHHTPDGDAWVYVHHSLDNREASEMPEETTPDAGDEDVLAARITIERHLSSEDLFDSVDAVDADGAELPLAEALGMMRIAEDTLIRSRLDSDADDADGEDDQ